LKEINWTVGKRGGARKEKIKIRKDQRGQVFTGRSSNCLGGNLDSWQAAEGKKVSGQRRGKNFYLRPTGKHLLKKDRERETKVGRGG